MPRSRARERRLIPTTSRFRRISFPRAVLFGIRPVPQHFGQGSMLLFTAQTVNADSERVQHLFSKILHNICQGVTSGNYYAAQEPPDADSQRA